eukprot:symbB.v1.2.025160.t2/scaffold2343.1/size81760/1
METKTTERGSMQWRTQDHHSCLLRNACARIARSIVQRWVASKEKVEWRTQGQVSFPEATAEGHAVELSGLRFGVQGRVTGFGGTGKAVFFGLIRDHMPGINKSFLEQTPFKSFEIDLRYPGRETLELSTSSSRSPSGGEILQRVKLVDPRRWGDPVKHYSALATIRVGGEVVMAEESSRKVLVIFDTGTTGASMTNSLYGAYLQIARKKVNSGTSWSQARQIEVVFDSDGSQDAFSMYIGKHPNYGLGLDLVTPIGEMAWVQEKAVEKPFEDVMLMGLGFLIGKRMAIDMSTDECTVAFVDSLEKKGVTVHSEQC